MHTYRHYLGDNVQITAAFVLPASDCFVVFQLTYKNQSNRCLSNTTFPSGFCVTFTSNHWLDLKNVNNDSISLPCHTYAIKIYFRFDLNFADEQWKLTV